MAKAAAHADGDDDDATTPPFPTSIAIIGASLTGLSLTLSLLQHDLFPADAITLYDQRAAPHNSSGSSGSSSTTSALDPSSTSSGVVLTPNGLSVLSSLGVLARVADQCWTSAHRTYRSDEGDRLVRKVQVSGEEEYGFRNHRLWRALLVEEMLRMCEERGVRVKWGWRFDGVDSEGQGGVRFGVVSGTGEREERSAWVLVGADGIWSSVRRYLDQDAKPEYTGTTGVLAHVRWDDVDWPHVPEGTYERQCTLQGKAGALFWIPEDEKGSVIMIGNQVKMEGEKSREEWDRLAKDKDYLCEFYRKDYDEWGPTGKKIIDAVCRNRDSLYLWPFMRMARLQRWSSRAGRVVIMGDAAHALPPSSGQGVNQTLEDVYVLTKVLTRVKDGCKSLVDALHFWQQVRQQRVDQVFEWATNATNVQRLPRAERERLVQSSAAKSQQEVDDMRWLYKPDWDARIAQWSSG